jgi:hypothetical protein
MNDYEEMQFGIEEGVRILKESAGSTFTDLMNGSDNFDKLLQHYLHFIDVFKNKISMDVYVFCLSEFDSANQPSGLLSMWRGYGAHYLS